MLAARDPRAAVARRVTWIVVGVVAALFVLYAWITPAHFASFNVRAYHRDQYNLLTDGMLEGHLYLKEEIPPGLIAMADPYNPNTNGVYRYQHGLWDQSYYDGKCYLYFGVTPVLSLFLPFRVLTGGLRMPQALAVLVYTSLALVFAAGLLGSLRRRYFAESPPWMMGAGVLLVGTANIACYLLSQSNIYQVAIACGMCFSLGSLYFLTRAFERTRRRLVYLFAAGAFLALAVGSRPHFAATGVLLFGIAVFELWRRGSLDLRTFGAFVLPFATGGAMLAMYNFLRFGSFTEFGAKYQLAIIDMRRVGMFGISHIPSTMYFMFLQPPTLNGKAPYLHPMPKLPSWLDKPEVFLLERVTGLLTSTPFLWMIFVALGVAWWRRGRSPAPLPKLELAWIGVSSAVLVLVLSMTGGTMRYLADFASLLDLAAVVAWFWVDRRLADAPRAQAVSRGVGLLLILVSAAIGPTLALPPPSHYMDG